MICLGSCSISKWLLYIPVICYYHLRVKELPQAKYNLSENTSPEHPLLSGSPRHAFTWEYEGRDKGKYWRE